MTLTDQIKVDAKIFLNPKEFGETITYDPKGAPVARAINALIDSSFDVDTGSLINTRQSIVILSDGVTVDPVTGFAIGIANPQVGDKCTIRGKTCRVEDHILNEDGQHDLTVEVGA